MSIRQGDNIIAGLNEAIGLEIGDIGIAPFGINEAENKRRYLNGQTISQTQFKVFTKKIKKMQTLYPSLFCTNDEFEGFLIDTDLGQCGKFVVDDIAGTIRLPRVINIQGLADLNEVGNLVKAGLPNIEGEAGKSISALVSGAFYKGKSVSSSGTTSGDGNVIILDASRSNSIYGKSTTVQEEAIQYPYFIQVATGVKEIDSVVNTYQLNNPFFFGMYQYFQSKPNNLSWLESNNAFYKKTSYPSYYEWLLRVKSGSEILDGFNVKYNNEEFTDYDYILNTTDETFRLPLKVKGASGSAIKGNGKTLGLTDGTNNGGLAQYGGSSAGKCGCKQIIFNTPVGTNSQNGDFLTENKSIGVTPDSSKSGIETDNKDLYLYFYVGEVIQNANLVNASDIINNKLNTDGSNATQQGKETITTWGIPDYNNPIATKVAMTEGLAFTASQNCYVVATVFHGSSTQQVIIASAPTGDHSTYISIQGVTSPGWATCTAYVAKNKTIYFKGLAGTNMYYNVYPLLGEQ